MFFIYTQNIKIRLTAIDRTDNNLYSFFVENIYSACSLILLTDDQATAHSALFYAKKLTIICAFPIYSFR